MFPPEFEDLRGRLRANGVPPRRVQRLVDELSDHLQLLATDLSGVGIPTSESLAEARIRIGDDDLLARRILADSRNVASARRHPAIWFGALPIPAACACLLVYGFAACNAARWFLELTGRDSTSFSFAALVLPLHAFAAYALIPVVAAWSCVVAARGAVALAWPFLACFLLAVFGGLLALEVQLPDAEPGTGVLMVALSAHLISWSRFVAPLAVFAMFALTQRRSERPRSASC
jgi:hypothetical protein